MKRHNKNFANNLRIVLYKRNINQVQLSKTSGVCVSTIGSIISGRRGIGLNIAIKICDALKLSIDEMISDLVIGVENNANN